MPSPDPLRDIASPAIVVQFLFASVLQAVHRYAAAPMETRGVIAEPRSQRVSKGFAALLERRLDHGGESPLVRNRHARRAR